MEFRNAAAGELPQIVALYHAAIGTPGCTWNEHYPGAFELEHDFSSNNLYVLAESETVIGAVSVVSPNELDDACAWNVTNAREIARVVISHKYAGRGLAVQMLTWLFEKLRRDGCDAIHISVACCNTAAINTYKNWASHFWGKPRYTAATTICTKSGCKYLNGQHSPIPLFFDYSQPDFVKKYLHFPHF